MANVRNDGFRVLQTRKEFAGRYTRHTAQDGEDEAEFYPEGEEEHDIRALAASRMDYTRDLDRGAFRGLNTRKHYQEYVDPYEEDRYAYKPESADNIEHFKQFVHQESLINALKTRIIRPKASGPARAQVDSRARAVEESFQPFQHVNIDMRKITSKSKAALPQSLMFQNVVYYFQPKLLNEVADRHPVNKKTLQDDMEMYGLVYLEDDKDENTMRFRLLDNQVLIDNNTEREESFVLRVHGAYDSDAGTFNILTVSLEPEHFD